MRIRGGVASLRNCGGTATTNFNIASCQKTPPITLLWCDGDVPWRDSFNAPGGEFRLLSVPDRGESVVCSWWTVRQSDRVSWVAEDFIWQRSTQVHINMLYIQEQREASLIWGRTLFLQLCVNIKSMPDFWRSSLLKNMTRYNMNSICIIILTAYVMQKCTGPQVFVCGTFVRLVKSLALISFD